MDLGPLQDIQLDSDFSWEIKSIVFVLYSLEINESLIATTLLLIPFRSSWAWLALYFSGVLSVNSWDFHLAGWLTPAMVFVECLVTETVHEASFE